MPYLETWENEENSFVLLREHSEKHRSLSKFPYYVKYKIFIGSRIPEEKFSKQFWELFLIL